MNSYILYILFRTFSILLLLLTLFNITNTDISKLQAIVNCADRPIRGISKERGKFWVFYNYVPASNSHKCYETVTYTTHADYSFLSNLEVISERWDGPISLAIYAPGEDFDIASKSIAYLRDCRSPKIKQLVTFHVFFDILHAPKENIVTQSHGDKYNCELSPPYKINKLFSYRHKHNLTYPINVARNVARLTARTYFVFPSDIELYPVHNFSQRFMTMIADNPHYLHYNERGVFVVPVFEVSGHSRIPSTKTELQIMLKNGTAQPFHIKLCSICHKVPHIKEWTELKESEDFHVFITASRKSQYAHWEPFYVGTQREPLFDERLTWEGQYNKMTQAFAMCLLDYDYMILDNAFLVHKPGVKKSKDQLTKYFHLVMKTNVFIRHVIYPELLRKYGKQPGCKL